MKDQSKTKQVLIQELASLKQKIAELEQAESERKRVEEALRESEEKYRNLFENANEAIFVAQDGKIVFLNPSTAIMTGYSVQELVLRPFIDFIHRDDQEMVIDRHVRRMKGEELPHRYSFRIIHRGGSIRWVELNAVLINWNGKAATLNFLSDITDRKLAEEALRENEEKYRLIFDNAPLGILHFNEKGIITSCNDKFVEIIGSSREVLVGLNMVNLPDQQIVSAVKMALNGNLGYYDDVYRSVTANKNTPAHALFAPITSGKGEVIGGVGIIEDITDRKKMEAALRKSEAEKSVILESVSDMIFYIDTNMLVIYSNLAMEKFFNLPSSHLEGKTCYNALHHRDKPCSVCPALEAMQSGKPHESYISSFGRHWRLSGYPVRDESGAIVGAIEAVSDITDLRNAEEKCRSIFDNAMEGIYQSTPDGRLISVNPALAKIFGYDSPENMMSEVTSVERSIYDDPDRRQAFLNLAEEQGIAKNFEFEGSKKNGELIYVSDNSRAVKDSKGNTIYYEGIIQDITDRKRAEDALRESEENFRRSLDESPLGVRIVSEEGETLYVNRKILDLFGYDSIEEWQTIPAVKRYTEQSYAEFNVRREKRRLGNDVSSEYEIDIVRKDGDVRHLHVWRKRFFWNGQGHYQAIYSDITERKLAEQERKRLEDQLKQAQKLEAIGTLAGGIAHDFNNLMMGIQGYASLMLLDLDAYHPHYERLKRIEQQVQSGANLTKQLLGFARGGRYEARPTDMNEIIDRTVSMFGRTKKEIAVHRSLAGDLWTVDCDQGQMEQVFMNLYVNAWQAMPGGGELYLETGNFLLDDDLLMSYTIKPGRYIKISMTDTGTGMDASTRERIFDPFFTTKAMGRGTGLGLATVYGIIKGHKGMIDVTSEPGQGTTFDIYLPASEKTIDKEKPAATEIMTGTETVLLVDDEQMVLEVTRELLEYMGYRVYAAGSGQEAIAVYMEKRNDIDLVILDMIMPGISGGETFDRLHEINPDAKVLLSSGYSINGQAQQILERGCNGFLQKPFHLENLSQKVREVLSG